MRLTSCKLLLAADTGNYVYRFSGVILFYTSVLVVPDIRGTKSASVILLYAWTIPGEITRSGNSLRSKGNVS
jgi:hypothetical protein